MKHFRELVDSAIESRRPLDTPEFARLAAEAAPGDRRYWQAQVRLDAAVAGWRNVEQASTPLASSRPAEGVGYRSRAVWRMAATGQTAAVLVVGLTVGYLLWPSARVPTVTATSVVSVEAGVPSEPAGPVVAPRAPVRALESPADARETLALAPHDRFNEATVTAERLAYAFQPVGEQVGTVMRFLIDAVPGSDVFSM